MNPLLCIFHCREIPEFREHTDKLKIDKLWMNFYPQGEAYAKAREWFLAHKEYTHFVILPDDLLATQQALDILVKDAKNHIDVVSGWCNNTAGLTDDVYTDFSFQLPPMQTSSFELYNFATIAEVTKYSVNYPVIPVPHQGTALTFIHRKILEQIKFRQDKPPDLGLAHDLAKRGISQYVDLRARMTHMRHPHGILVGKKKKEIILETKTV